MKHKLALLLAVVVVTMSAFVFAGSNRVASDELCPLRGTPACPEYPSCCR